MSERILTDEAQAERDEFHIEYGHDGNCSCHLSPPCGSCTHPGNPMNQAEDETAWRDSCPHCDETGEVTRADGEYMGRCTCPAGKNEDTA